MNERIASYLDEIFDKVNQYLLWDPMSKTTCGGYFCKALYQRPYGIEKTIRRSFDFTSYLTS